MMEDWTDIIGEELENIEEPLPADDWNVLQQKYAASKKRKKAAVFAWAGGITSVAAAVALVLLLFRPETFDRYEGYPVKPGMAYTAIPDSIGDLNDLVAEPLPPIEEVAPVDSNLVESSTDSAHYVAPSVRKKASDTLIAENHTEEIPSENAEEVFDVIRDTTSLKDKLIADASTANKEDSSEDAYNQPTGTFGFDDFPEDEQRRKRRPMSIGMSGSISGSPIIKMMDLVAPEVPPDYESPGDTSVVVTPAPSAVMMRGSRNYNEFYSHGIPISFGVSLRYCLTDRISVNTGLNYTRYTSTRERYYNSGLKDFDKQYAHYLGIPVRLDWLAVSKKAFNFYIGAGVQADKCIYATVGNEKLHEKEVLFGLNGALGIQVNIVPMVGLYFEPEISYALNEGTIETFRSDKSLVVTVRGGLRFNF